MRAKFAAFAFHALRALESCLPPEGLYWFLLPGIVGLTVFDRIRWRHHMRAIYGVRDAPAFAWKHSFEAKFNRVLPFYPDRLPAPRWLRRCRFVGLDRLQQTRAPGQPLVLVFCHFGPVQLLGEWLRAAGLPASTLVAEKSSARSPDKDLKDRVMPFPETPAGCYYDRKRDAIELLDRGGAMLIAVDFLTGNLVRAPVGDGVTFTMATGAIRLAARKGAVLAPCAIVDRRRWRFCVEIGRPTPPEWLVGELDFVRICQWLYREFKPMFEADPAQRDPLLDRCFQPDQTTRS